MTQELNERVIPFGEAVDTLRSFIHDPAGDVQTDSGPMPNLRKIHEELRHSGAVATVTEGVKTCLLYTSPSPRDQRGSRMPSSA